MKRKISQLGLSALIAASSTITLASCATSKGHDDKSERADVTTDDEMDAGYMTLSDAELDAVTQTNDFAINLFRTQAGMDSKGCVAR